MEKKFPINTEWFRLKLREKGRSASALAAFLGLDKSAVSRLLNGGRDVSAEEQDKIAQFLGVDVAEVAMHRRGKRTGFAEKKQEAYVQDLRRSALEPPVDMFTEADIIHKDGKRWMEAPDGTLIELHPAFGCMKGTITVMPGVDLTAPMDWDEEWGEKLYNE